MDVFHSLIVSGARKANEWFKSETSFCMLTWQRKMSDSDHWPVFVCRAPCRHDKDNDWYMSVFSLCMKGIMQAWQRQWLTHVSVQFVYDGHHAGMTKTMSDSCQWPVLYEGHHAGLTKTMVTHVSDQFCMKGTMQAWQRQWLTHVSDQFCMKGTTGMTKDRWVTHIGDQFLYEGHHASHVVKDLHQLWFHILQGECIIILLLLDCRYLPNHQPPSISAVCTITPSPGSLLLAHPQVSINQRSLYNHGFSWTAIIYTHWSQHEIMQFAKSYDQTKQKMKI